MKLIQWTFFIDMLGYREINGGINSEEKAEDFVKFMLGNKGLFEKTDSDYIRGIYKKDKNFDFYKFYDIKYAFVSDSLIITYYPKEVDENIDQFIYYNHSANALFIAVMRMQAFIYHCFKEKGIFLRGGISNKYCYIKDGFVVGEGLIEAYKAESSLAINPRILLDPSIMKNHRIARGIKFISEGMYGGKSVICRDNDGNHFVDYIGYSIACVDCSIPMINSFKNSNPEKYWLARGSVQDFIDDHRKVVDEKIIELDKSIQGIKLADGDTQWLEKIKEKYVWLKKYHNLKIKGTDFSYLSIK